MLWILFVNWEEYDGAMLCELILVYRTWFNVVKVSGTGVC